MVSDLLREPPAPARVPAQAVRAHEPAREESEAALRRAREATAISPGRAQGAYEQAQQLAAEVRDRTEAAVERAVLPQLGEGDDDFARERAAGEKRLAEGQRQREMAAVPSWKSRPYGKRSDADLSRAVGLAHEAAGIAERGAREAAEKACVLEERLARERAAGQTRGQAVAAEAATLLDQAEAKQAAQQLARELNAKARAEELSRYLTDHLDPKKNMSRLELRIDRRDAQRLTSLQGEATKYTEAALKSRQTVAAVRTEQARRADIAEKFPELHEKETRARRSYAIEQKPRPSSGPRRPRSRRPPTGTRRPQRAAEDRPRAGKTCWTQ
ncbi:hypothetical protein GCM10027073_34430 [Streptomyces chlorus]|uniref:Uncharacterized protein n=1 Tax=Streptomyces chlorus TaxID=887452 RepID=A0ABW1EAA6_9ACTN